MIFLILVDWENTGKKLLENRIFSKYRLVSFLVGFCYIKKKTNSCSYFVLCLLIFQSIYNNKKRNFGDTTLFATYACLVLDFN